MNNLFNLPKSELGFYLFDGDFSKDEIEQLKNFYIKREYLNINDDFLLSEFVDASDTIGFYSTQYLQDLVIMYKSKSNLYLRLSIIDYLDYFQNYNNDMVEIFNDILPLDNRLLIKSQLLLSIYSINPTESNFNNFKNIFNRVVKNHSKYKTYYRIISRTFSKVVNMNLQSKMHKPFINYLADSIAKLDEIYRSEIDILNEFKNKYKLLGNVR